mmetsp:Transcript_10879/g.28762  ORF Transcript_10879/g.28762 Transcript_10879/m.28762 type:complete len:113 (+) Transcript_10879:161-499(+)
MERLLVVSHSLSLFISVKNIVVLNLLPISHLIICVSTKEWVQVECRCLHSWECTWDKVASLDSPESQEDHEECLTLTQEEDQEWQVAVVAVEIWVVCMVLLVQAFLTQECPV